MKSNKFDFKYKEQKGALIDALVRKIVLLVFLLPLTAGLASIYFQAEDPFFKDIVFGRYIFGALGVFSLFFTLFNLGETYNRCKDLKDFLQKPKTETVIEEKEVIHIEGVHIQG